MPSVQGITQCPQCGYDRADTELNCRTQEGSTHCRKCGYREYFVLEKSGDGAVTFQHKIVEGAGVFFIRKKGSCVDQIRYLATQEKVTESVEWLRQRLASGEVHPSTAYVSRWNAEAKAVEFEVGRFLEDDSYDPDDELP